MNKTVWKVWVQPKIKSFAWLVIQNRIWMTDRPEKRRWTNYNIFPLCKQTQESVAHLFSHYRYTNWGMIKERLGIESIDTNNWLEEIAIDI
jgi:hypothetical protein